MVTASVGAEQRMKDLGITLPPSPAPLGAYVEAVQTGNLLFLTGMLPVMDGKAKYVGRIGVDLDPEDGRDAAYIAFLNGLAVIREHLGSLDKVGRIVRLCVYIVADPDFRDHPKLADGASELLEDIFGKERTSSRMVMGIASLPLGAPVAVELIVEALG